MSRLTRAILIAAICGGSIVCGSNANASKPFTPVTKLQCAKCHTSPEKKDMSEKDLSDVGKKALETLKKGGYVRGKTEQEQRDWANKLLKEFKP